MSKHCQRGNSAFGVVGVLILHYLQKDFIIGSSSVQIRLTSNVTVISYGMIILFYFYSPIVTFLFLLLFS